MYPLGYTIAYKCFLIQSIANKKNLLLPKWMSIKYGNKILGAFTVFNKKVYSTFASVAQGIARPPPKGKVIGSNPIRGTSEIKALHR